MTEGKSKRQCVSVRWASLGMGLVQQGRLTTDDSGSGVVAERLIKPGDNAGRWQTMRVDN